MYKVTLLTLLILGSLSGCATNLSPHSCKTAPEPDQDGHTPVDTRSNHDKSHDCGELDAALFLTSALFSEKAKGESCRNKTGKAKQECDQQVRDITNSIKKRTQN